MKRGQKSPEAGWRFLRSNDRLRGVILSQMAEKKLNATALAKQIGVNHARMGGYLRGVSTPCLSEFQVVQVCDYLGIELDLEIQIRGQF